MSRTLLLALAAACGLAASPAGAAEIVWARGSAEGNVVGRYDDGAKWYGGVVPGASDRARVDIGGTALTIDSTVVANDFLFGVNAADQHFVFTDNADVTLAKNFIVAHNRGNVTADLAAGSRLELGESLVLGQESQPGRDDEDVTVYLRGEAVMRGGIILGLRYSGNVSGVDLLVEVSGPVRTDNVQVANDGDADAFLAPARNNTARVSLTPTGTLTLVGDKVERARKLVERGLLVASEAGSELDIVLDGEDTVVTSTFPEPG